MFTLFYNTRHQFTCLIMTETIVYTVSDNITNCTISIAVLNAYEQHVVTFV